MGLLFQKKKNRVHRPVDWKAGKNQGTLDKLALDEKTKIENVFLTDRLTYLHKKMEDPLDAHFDKKKTELKEEKMQASSISGLITGRIGRFTDWQQGTANAWRKSRRKLSSRTGSRGKFNKRERNSTQNVERNVITDK